MTPDSLLAELRRRGIELRAAGDRLLYRPEEALDPELRVALRTHKAAVLAGLRRDSATDVDGLLSNITVTEAHTETTAYRLYSKLLERDLWLCRDRRAAVELLAEFPGTPVLTFAEVPLLKGKSKDALRAILDTKAEFPEARLRC